MRQTNTVVATIPVGVEPFGIAYGSLAESEIIVVNYESDSKNYSFSVISDHSNTVVATVPLLRHASICSLRFSKRRTIVPNWFWDIATHLSRLFRIALKR